MIKISIKSVLGKLTNRIPTNTRINTIWIYDSYDTINSKYHWYLFEIMRKNRNNF